jgi:hypothetical protein
MDTLNFNLKFATSMDRLVGLKAATHVWICAVCCVGSDTNVAVPFSLSYVALFLTSMLCICSVSIGHALAQAVETLGSFGGFTDLILPAGPGVDTASNRNEQ